MTVVGAPRPRCQIAARANGVGDFGDTATVGVDPQISKRAPLQGVGLHTRLVGDSQRARPGLSFQRVARGRPALALPTQQDPIPELVARGVQPAQHDGGRRHLVEVDIQISAVVDWTDDDQELGAGPTVVPPESSQVTGLEPVCLGSSDAAGRRNPS